MMNRFQKQTQGKWKELIHDGPRLESPGTNGMIMILRRKQYPLQTDITKSVRDFFLLKPDQQVDFKEGFEAFLRDMINKSNPTAVLTHLELDECKFVECPPTNTLQGLIGDYDPTILLDGRTYHYTSGVDPSGFFFGRGDAHPYKGCYRRRILPEDITINRSSWLHKELEIHRQWGGVVCEPYASWLASWKDPVTNKVKYIFIPKNTEHNQRTDKLKYDAAFELSKKIEEIRQDYWTIIENYKNTDHKLLQIALVLYLVDHFSIRIGNPSEDRTFGACTLRKDHVRLLRNNFIQLDFPGKDSVRYCRKHDIHPCVYGGLRMLLSGPSDRIFPSCTPGDINKYLQVFGEFSIKSFRTMNACLLCNGILQKDMSDETVKEKLARYSKACSHVAEICNHQRRTPYGSLTYSVATGKGNYIDPRIVVAFCKRNALQVGQCYSKALMEKNSWALDERSPWDVYY